MTSGFLATIDLVEILFTLFWVFFIALVLYLHRESKREGYPLVSDRSKHILVQGFPNIPKPKTFVLPSGRKVQVPRGAEPELDVAGERVGHGVGSPLVPTGDPMLSGLGPGAYSERPDVVEPTLEGEPRIVPLRKAPSFDVDSADLDPRGMPVEGADGIEVGTVTDCWIDLAEPQIYYLEVRTGGEEDGRTVLVPFGFAEMDKRARRIRVNAIYSHQFANAPTLSSPDQISLREEDRIVAYYGGGLMFADEKRGEPIL